MKNGAVVHGARDEVELQRLVDKLGVEIVVAAVKPPRRGCEKLCVNGHNSRSST
jgi:hypothetical protein